MKRTAPSMSDHPALEHFHRLASTVATALPLLHGSVRHSTYARLLDDAPIRTVRLPTVPVAAVGRHGQHHCDHSGHPTGGVVFYFLLFVRLLDRQSIRQPHDERVAPRAAMGVVRHEPGGVRHPGLLLGLPHVHRRNFAIRPDCPMHFGGLGVDYSYRFPCVRCAHAEFLQRPRLRLPKLQPRRASGATFSNEPHRGGVNNLYRMLCPPCPFGE
mmetsp:Transcript_60760/g.166868  ORF Transcript_60760/g.166868 Transcript_60760/m.166868 type:complete len:214 (+) Transcript_60760:167-808(+)